MQIGDKLIHDGRRYVLLGFDPEGVTPRMIYLEDEATGARVALPFEGVNLTGRRTSRRLRLVRRPDSSE
jgi:hypothetical protein